MSVAAAMSFAQTVLSYFSPTKSPYYSVIAFGTSALILSAPINQNWGIIYFPIAILLFYSTLLSIFDKPNFDEKEYDDQIKFSRAFSLSAAVLCLVFTGIKIKNADGELGNQWYFWLAYAACMTQLCIFSFYIYVYANLKTKPVSRNFVQLALITSTYLIGLVYSNISYHGDRGENGSHLANHFLYITISLSAFWFVTILVWLDHLKKSLIFKVLVPEDAKSQIND